MTNLCSHPLSSSLGTFHRWEFQTHLMTDSETYGDIGFFGRMIARMTLEPFLAPNPTHTDPYDMCTSSHGHMWDPSFCSAVVMEEPLDQRQPRGGKVILGLHFKLQITISGRSQ